jgi:hypothetical protein
VRVAAPPSWVDHVARHLDGCGVVVDDAAEVGLAVTVHREPTPEVDTWSVESRPHLLLGVWDHTIEVGPWVAPGVGPCARCVEADTLDAVRRQRGLPEPAPWLWSTAAGLVARDLALWSAGRRPATWATRWRVTGEPVPEAERSLRHPYCGCAWWDIA